MLEVLPSPRTAVKTLKAKTAAEAKKDFMTSKASLVNRDLSDELKLRLMLG
jgi:hypothetical protein